MTEALKSSISPGEIAEILQRAGYRANVIERDGIAQVHSAAQGLEFFVAFTSSGPVQQARQADLAFHCWLLIRDELPPELIDGWNRSRRFARLFRQGQVLVLTMDILLAGGVSEAHLHAQCELWDRLIRDLVLHVQRSGKVQLQAPLNGQAAVAGGGGREPA